MSDDENIYNESMTDNYFESSGLDENDFKRRSRSQNASAIFNESFENGRTRTLSPGMTRIRTKEVERHVRWKNVHSMVSAQNDRLVNEKEELNQLNDRLNLLVESIKVKKAQNDDLQELINRYREELMNASNSGLKTQYSKDLDNTKRELNDVSEISTMSKIRASRSMYELDRLKDQFDTEMRFQNNNREKIRLLESQRAESLHELSYLKENCESKAQSMRDDSDKNVKLAEQLRMLMQNLDREQLKRVDLECKIQTMQERKKFDQDVSRIMRDELERLFVYQGENRLFDPHNFYKTELRDIKERIRDDFIKLNEFNLETLRGEYEHRYTHIVEEIEVTRRNAEAARAAADEVEAMNIANLSEEFKRNQLELEALKANELKSGNLYEELKKRLGETQYKIEIETSNRNNEILALEEKINILKNDLSSMLGFSKTLDAEVAVYARLLNERFSKYLSETIQTNTTETKFSFDKYKNSIFRPKPTDSNEAETRRRHEQEELKKKQRELEENHKRLKELEAERERERERERLRKQKENEIIRMEREKAEQERIERERQRIEQQRIENEKRMERKRQEQERIEQERIEREKQRAEQERIENERRAERKRLEQERIERERQERERQRAEQERLENERRLERKRLEEERMEFERKERERIERERAERDQKERERIERERLRIEQERQRIDQERYENERRLEIQRAEQERYERERLEELEKIKREKSLERVRQEKLELERLEKERIDQERLEYERRFERQRIEQERIERERSNERKRIEQERIDRERSSERKRLEQERIEREHSNERKRIELENEQRKRQFEEEKAIIEHQKQQQQIKQEQERQQRLQEESDRLRKHKEQEQTIYQQQMVIEKQRLNRENQIRLEQERQQRLQYEREEHEKYIIEKLRQEQELIEIQQRKKAIMEQREREKQQQQQQQQQVRNQPQQIRAIDTIDNISSYTKRIVEEKHQTSEFIEEHRVEHVPVNVRIPVSNWTAINSQKTVMPKVNSTPDDLSSYEKQINIKLIQQPLHDQHNSSLREENSTSSINRHHESSFMTNQIDHCITSNNGQKHVLIVNNYQGGQPSANIETAKIDGLQHQSPPSHIRPNSPPVIRKIVRSSGESQTIESAQNKTNPSNKYAIKHKANRYVSGAIGILETSLNGEYIILENLSSNKTVNLKGWYIHRYVPDQNINVIFKFNQDTFLTSGEKLKILSRLHSQRPSIKSASMHEGLNNPNNFNSKSTLGDGKKGEEKVLVAHNVDNWGTYSKFSVTKLINPEGVDKAVLTQSLLRMASSTSHVNAITANENTNLTESEERYRSLKQNSNSSININRSNLPTTYLDVVNVKNVHSPRNIGGFTTGTPVETISTTTTKKTVSSSSTSSHFLTSHSTVPVNHGSRVAAAPSFQQGNNVNNIHVTRQF